MTPIVNGSLAKQFVSKSIKFDPSSGKTVVTQWVGANDVTKGEAGNALIGYAKSLETIGGVSYELKIEGAKSTLTETASDEASTGSETTIDRWEVLANENMYDIKELSSWASLPTGADNLQTAVLKDVRRYEDGKKPTYDFLDEDNVTSWTDQETATAQSFYNLMTRGVTHYPLHNWVLRHTTNVNADYSRNVADEGVGTIYTTSQLLSEIGNSSYWVYPCPARLRTKIGGITEGGAVTGMRWGWLKKPSNESSTANNRIDISTEYVFAQWAILIYG